MIEKIRVKKALLMDRLLGLIGLTECFGRIVSVEEAKKIEDSLYQD